MCSPCGPMVCYKYEDCGPPKGRPSAGASEAEEGGSKKKAEKENQLKRIKSRELRGGIMYYSCHCIKRNGLQHDCRRTGCGGEPACLVLPDPLCAPSQLARARGLADPAPLAAHMRAQDGGAGGASSDSGSGSGKRFIVCELKGIMPDVSADKGGKCCKCPSSHVQTKIPGIRACICLPDNCPCSTSASSPGDQLSMYAFDEATLAKIFDSFDKKEVVKEEGRGGVHGRKSQKPVTKAEPCTRPGCVHWKPPPPCVWDLPCKADCFEAHPGIQPGRNKYMSGGMIEGETCRSGRRPGVVMLSPEYCYYAGCSTPGGTSTGASGGPAAGLPMLVMKLC
ncbi:uncharacterized protein LOC106135455 [Amyelois transitella]|uniref:uncharacterized protein LOC106135455 n=1 Tax=Amyelois transitella TaxID=680683 RepID=UPI00299037BA|nr:uncharacterized protein LOC106135455 [Amyelois transitella]